MTRLEKVYEGLCQNAPTEGITAGELAAVLHLTRANCSFDLNRLCDEGKAQKHGSKPVYYRPLQESIQQKNILQTFISRNPSLSKCGDLAKAAVLYPPNGMNILLLGETGVGKSMFASLIHDFSCSVKKNAAHSRLVTFNCADYANNPQLLLSQLFGVVKGSYTGAVQDKPGLIEQADGGILFLDEVHRLPAEGQEMLFTYMDRGVFRRLGETNSERKVTVMLICATTEEPGSALLQTFLRRLPVVIQLPGLAERSLEERQQLIALFFSQESIQLNAPIFVSVNSMRALLGYSCPGNVGQLAGDIRLLCARAYADFISGDKSKIQITSFSLPAHIRNGFLNERSRKDLWNRFGVGHGRYFIFQPDGSMPDFNTVSDTNIYDLVDQQTTNMKRVGIPEKDIYAEINTLLEQYYQRLGNDPASVMQPDHLIDPEIIATTDKILDYASAALNKRFPDNIRHGLTLHIFNSLKRIHEKKPIEHPNQAMIQTHYPMEWKTAMECLDILKNDFDISIPDDEAAFLTHFFITDVNSVFDLSPTHVIVIAHGTGTASGMVEVANHLFQTKAITGFDMPMDQSPGITYQQVRSFLEKHPHITNVLLLVDMGSLSDFSKDLEQDLSLSVRIVSMVSTLHVVEAARMTALGHPLEEIYQNVFQINHSYEDEIPVIPEPGSASLYIVTVCTTGDGSAKMACQLLEKQLDLTNCLCEIVQLSIADPQLFDAQIARLKTQGRIVAVVGAFKTQIEVPHVSLTDILNGNGILMLQKRLNWESLRFRMVDTISDLLDQVDSSAAISKSHDLVTRLTLELQADLSEEMMVGIFSHLVFMLNRLKKGIEPPLFPNKEALYKKYPGVVATVEHECRLLGQQFGVQISGDEICYISAFFTKENFNQISWNR